MEAHLSGSPNSLDVGPRHQLPVETVVSDDGSSALDCGPPQLELSRADSQTPLLGCTDVDDSGIDPTFAYASGVGVPTSGQVPPALELCRGMSETSDVPLLASSSFVDERARAWQRQASDDSSSSASADCDRGPEHRRIASIVAAAVGESLSRLPALAEAASGPSLLTPAVLPASAEVPEESELLRSISEAAPCVDGAEAAEEGGGLRMPVAVACGQSSDGGLPACYQLVRTVTSASDPRSPVSNIGEGYVSKLARQHPVPEEAKRNCPIADVRCGRAGLKDGTYLFVVMIGDPDHLRLIHEEELLASDWRAGHSSLLSLREFTRNWANQWRAHDPAAFRCTVLFAGELEYMEGAGVLWWNNCSGHFRPDSEDHTRVQLDPERFVPADLTG